MTAVRGTQLLLPEGLAAAAAADALAAELAVVTTAAHTLQRTFWDTFDGRLHAAGIALVATAGRLVVVDQAKLVEEVGANAPKGAVRLLAADLPAGPLRERLAPIIEMRALTPIARVRSRLLPINVLDDVGKIVVRLRVEEPTGADASGAVKLALRPRLHAVGVRGYDGDYERTLELLTGRLGLQHAPQAVQDEAVAAAGGTVGGTSSKLRVTLDAAERADAAAAKVLRRLLDVVKANLAGTLADIDSEFLHDLRVAVRRSRALQRELSGVFPPEPLRVFRDGFKELQAVTGPTRDLDVQLLEFEELTAGLPGEDDVAPLRRLLEQHLAAARAEMAAALRSPGTRALLDNWSEFLDGLVEADESDRPDAARPIGEVAGERIWKVYRRMVKMGRAIDEDSPAEALHELRKKGKELRYLLEFFASLYPAEVVKPMVATLKRLQDVLGRFQDREVQADLLRALGHEVAALDGGAPALMAMGLLVQRLGDEQAQARAEFAERFAEFAASEQRALVRTTFA